MDGLPRVRRRDLKLVRLSFVAVQEASKTVASYYRIREDCFRPAGSAPLSSNIAHNFASNRSKIVLAQMIYYPTVLYQFLNLLSTALVPCICTFQFPKIAKRIRFSHHQTNLFQDAVRCHIRLEIYYPFDYPILKTTLYVYFLPRD